ncbi:hypothetical protein SAMN05444166_5678 [Singulisphaera sp. GP187]|nr:hypothetical protein SAMN05444166_5678 [Singulisphaera sp. GP187]
MAAGRPQASQAQREARLAVCAACPEYDEGRCRLCGCFLATKAGWADQECPVGKWMAIVPMPAERLREAPVEPALA